MTRYEQYQSKCEIIHKKELELTKAGKFIMATIWGNLRASLHRKMRELSIEKAHDRLQSCYRKDLI